MYLIKEAQEIAREALKEADGCFYGARLLIDVMCENHELSIYDGKAIQFCAEHNTSHGEDFLEETQGCIGLEGDSFGSIARKVAWATLAVLSNEALEKFEEEAEAT